MKPVRDVTEAHTIDDIADRATEHRAHRDPQERVPLRQGSIIEDQDANHDQADEQEK